MKYDVILMDIDNTLLDFDAGSAAGLTRLLSQFGLQLTQLLLQRFLAINSALWEQYEAGEIEKTYIYPTRFERFLGELGIQTDWLAANEIYGNGLRQSCILVPGARELMERLYGKCRLYAVTNGVTRTQRLRLGRSGLDRYFDRIFISEEMGCRKPETLFFEKVFSEIGPVDRSRCILLGDSLTSDMQGGRNAGIATCFLGAPGDPRCDYCIDRLDQFWAVIA